VEESWNFVMRGSKANWACASFMCVAFGKFEWKCYGPASPTTCSIGSASKGSNQNQRPPESEKQKKEIDPRANPNKPAAQTRALTLHPLVATVSSQLQNEIGGDKPCGC
jgi:hypothetical protein